MTKTEFYEKWSPKLQYASDWAAFAEDLKALTDGPEPDYLTRRFVDAQLTAAEREIARMLLRGLTMVDMALQTCVAEKVVKHRVASIFHKFDVVNRTELFHKLFPPPQLER